MNESVTTKANIHRHFKGGLYNYLGRGNHSETMEPLDFYQSMSNGSLWGRPARMWDEKVKWPDGNMRPRFVPLADTSGPGGEPADGKL